MKIVADENCEREMIGALRAAGHDVVSVLDLSPSIDDTLVFGLAQDQGRILLTSDRDFGMIAEHASVRPPAVVLMRLERVSPSRRMELVVRTFAQLDDTLENQFIVIEPHQVRTRVYQP